MPFYLSSYIGTGTLQDAFRPLGSGQPGWSAIDLRPDGAQPAGRCLLWSPVHDPNPQLERLSDRGAEFLTAPRRTRLQNALGITLGATRFDLAVAELLTIHARTDGTRWRPLRPERTAGRFRVHLGGVLHEQPVISSDLLPPGLLAAVLARRAPVSRRKALAILGTAVAWGLWPRWAKIAEATSISENWNCADSASLTCQLTWTEFLGTSWQLASNVARLSGNVGENLARADSDLATDDHYVQVTLAAQTYVDSNLEIAPIARKNSTATKTFYMFETRRVDVPATNVHQLYKAVSATYTQLGSDVPDDVVVGEVVRISCDGSSIEGLLDGVSKIIVTDTAITGNLRGGIFGFNNGDTNVIDVDNWSAADIGALAATPLRTLMGVGT